MKDAAGDTLPFGLLELDPEGSVIRYSPASEEKASAVKADADLVVYDVMDELRLPSYPKTSGATGLHILTPVKPALPFPEVRRFAKALAQEVERRVPEIATTTWRVAERRGVFVDYGQNARDRTIAAAYSVRPTPDARVSAPLAWDEVADVDPAAFTLETMRARVAALGDLTAGMWRRKVDLASRFELLDLSPADPNRLDNRSRHSALEPWV